MYAGSFLGLGFPVCGRLCGGKSRGSHIVQEQYTLSRIALETLVLLFCASVIGLSADRALGQSTAQLVTGGENAGHVGQRCVGNARLGSSAAESTWSVVLGESRMLTIRPGGSTVALDAPTGSSKAFGSSGAIIRSYNSTSLDALVVGDPGYDAGRGRVAVYLGSSSFGSSPPLILEGGTGGDLFGASVADLGDVNHDGFGDLAVAATGHTLGAGRVYVYLGGATPPATAALEIAGTGPGDLFGSAISGIGDVNLDGYADFVVGAPGADASRGAVSVFHGGATLSATPDQVIPFPDTADTYLDRARFGAAIAGGGDLGSGDGRPDFAVGAPGVARGRGSVFIFSGAASAIDPAGREIPGLAAFDHFGSSLVIDTFIGKGTKDLAVGAPGASEGKGAVSLFYSGAGFDLERDLLLSGQRPDDGFGWSLGSGKVSQTLLSQILVGAPFSDAGGMNAGAAFYNIWSAPTAVEQLPVVVECDGATLKADTYTSTRPRFVVRMVGAAGVDSATAEITIDGKKQSVAAMSPRPGSGASQAGANTLSAGLEISTGELAEGSHTLRAQVYDSQRTKVGMAEVRFFAASRLRIQSPRMFPNPTSDIAHLAFTLTRPATYGLTVFDVAGRVVHRQGPTAGAAAANEVLFSKGSTGSRLASGVYFYLLRASYQGQQSISKGRVVFLR